MKKLLYLAAAFAALLACSKESKEPQGAQETNNNTPEKVVDDSNTVHELFVSLPDFTDAETKATINEANGYFSWTAGDMIAVVDDQDNVYPFVASESAKSVRFTYVGSIAGSLKWIYYPYIEESPYYITEMPTNLDSETAVLTSSNIRMSGEIVGNSATLSHNHAFVRLTFKNVPSFADKIRFYEEGNETPTLVTLTSTGSVTAYLPVHDGTQGITASIIDANNNVIISKYHNFGAANAFVKGSIKNMQALTVGYIIAVKNESQWESPAIYVWCGGNNHTYSTPNVTNIDGDDCCYVVLDQNWATEGAGVGVAFLQNGDWNDKHAQTDCVYLYRDIIKFICTGIDGSMKTTYRCYARFNDTQWGYWINQGSGTTSVKFLGFWHSQGESQSFADVTCSDVSNVVSSEHVSYYEFPLDWYGYDNVGLKFYNPENTAWTKYWDGSVTINRDFLLEP